jgi:hypothetical protein
LGPPFEDGAGFWIIRETCQKPHLVLTLLEQIPHHWHLYFLLLRPSRASFYAMSITTTLCPQSYGFHITVLSTLLLFALSKPVHPHQKHTRLFIVGTHGKELVPRMCLWWRWAESNRRPEHLSLCFIQQYPIINI